MSSAAMPNPSARDCMAIVRATPVREWSTDDRLFLGPWPSELPTWIQHIRADDGAIGSDATSLFGVLWGSCNELYNRLGPLQNVADSMPTIVATSDHVHDELKQGLAAIQTAVGSIQQASSNLGSSLSSITQLAAQAQASAAIANANATATGQRCAALESRASTLEAKAANHEARIAALEARKVITYRAAGNLPTLALNGTSSVTCPWTSAVPSPLPTVDQCQTFVAGSATPTVTAVSATGVTVSLKAIAVLLPAPGAVQVMATTYG